MLHVSTAASVYIVLVQWLVEDSTYLDYLQEKQHYFGLDQGDDFGDFGLDESGNIELYSQLP